MYNWLQERRGSGFSGYQRIFLAWRNTSLQQLKAIATRGLTETGNCAWKASSTQGRKQEEGSKEGYLSISVPSASQITYHSTLNSFIPITLGKGSKDSFTIRGWQLWLKHAILTLHALYFRSVFSVSSCVLKEFIRTRGTSHPYLLFKCCEEKMLVNII